MKTSTKIPTYQLVRAASRKRAQERASEERRTPAPKRPRVRGPEQPVQQTAQAAPEIDLTADTPPDRAAAEGASPGGQAAGPTATPEPVVAESPVSGGQAAPEVARDWGEGPSGAASPPPEPMAESSPPPGESENAEGVRGAEARARPPRDFLPIDGRRAERLLQSVFVPEVLEGLSHLKAATFFRESYAAIVTLANSLKAARDVIHGGKGILREAQKEAEEARARAEAAERALESAGAIQADEIRAAESRAEAEAHRLRAALNQLMETESAVAARDLHISELTEAIQAAESRADQAEEKARTAEEGKRAAREEARTALERMEAVEEEVGRVREEARAAAAIVAAEEAARASEAEVLIEARIAKALEDFRASSRFTEELAEASSEVFLQGFQYGKERVARDLNFPQALEVELEHASDVATPSSEPAPDEP